MEMIINVGGMSCEHCAKAVTDAVSAVDGVNSVSVDLEAKTATVACEPGIDNINEIKAAIEDQGFDVVD